MRRSVNHEIVRFNRSRVYLSDLVNQQDAFPSDLEAVRRLVDLRSHPSRGVRAQGFPIAIVATENAEEGHAALMKRSETECGAIVAGVHHHAHPFAGEALQ